MKGYKAFEQGMVCRGKQYQENTVFEEETAKICESGMHFCKHPLAVLNYYPLINEVGKVSEFAEVEALDECYTDDNEKYCTKKLKIGAKIGFPQLVQASVDFELKKAPTETKVKTSSKANAKIGSSGDYAKIGSSGDSAKIGSSGDSAKICLSGFSAQIGSSGDYAQICSSGDYAQICSSGFSAQIGSSGFSAQICSSGFSAQIGSSGDYAKIISDGLNSVICCAGNNSKVRAKKGSWITLSEWEYDEGIKNYKPKCVKTELVDGVKIKEDTFYHLVDGEFVEVEKDEKISN